VARAERHRRARAGRRRAGGPSTRTERRDAQSRRRGVAVLVASVAASAGNPVAWFPGGALIAQGRTLAQASSTLHELKAQDRALRVESKNLSTPSEVARIARQQFGLIVPGEQAYQVLPPPGTAGGATDPYSGDPGNDAPVSPSAAPELPPGTVEGSTATSGATAPGGRSHHAADPAPTGHPGFLGRILHSLEFWR